MKLIGLTAVAALAFASCQKQTTQDTAEATPDPIAESTPSPATPAPVARGTTPPPAPQLAPEGIFYLVSAARIETPDGVVGLPVGTGVKKIRDGVYLTPSGEAPLRPEQLTNDLTRARAARDAALAVAATARQRTVPSNTPRAPSAATTAAASTAAAASKEAAVKLAERARIEARLATLASEEEALKAQLFGLHEKRNKEMANAALKGRTVSSSTAQRISAMDAQLKKIQTETTTARQQLRNN
ncbi:MAG: hypothetical protein JWQ44_535 [Chthoniobacter sp.]|jgi:hypothetical protein|nr:hypothetical protein [Chthoniobacter sp.]